AGARAQQALDGGQGAARSREAARDERPRQLAQGAGERRPRERPPVEPPRSTRAEGGGRDHRIDWLLTVIEAPVPAGTSAGTAGMVVERGDAARILVVDDERVIREILAEFLTLEGFSVNIVEDGEKALTELRLHPYDLLITDLKMPRLSGLQLLEKVE